MRSIKAFFCVMASALLFLFTFGASASDLGHFFTELDALPVSSSKIVEYIEILDELKERVNPKLRAGSEGEEVRQFIAGRIADLEKVLKKMEQAHLFQNPPPSSALSSPPSSPEPVRKLLGYYHRYGALIDELERSANVQADPEPIPLMPSVVNYDTVRLNIHKTATDIEGDKIFLNKTLNALNFWTQSGEKRNADSTESPEERELQDIAFAIDVLDFEMGLKEIQKELMLLEREKSELARIGKNLIFEKKELEATLVELGQLEEAQRKQAAFFEELQKKSEADFFEESAAYGSLDLKEIVPTAGTSLPRAELAKRYVSSVMSGQTAEIAQRLLRNIVDRGSLWEKRFAFLNNQMSEEQMWNLHGELEKSIKSLEAEQAYDRFLFDNNYALSMQRLRLQADKASGDIEENLKTTLAQIEELLTRPAREYSLDLQHHLLLLYTMKEELDARLKGVKYARRIGALWSETADDLWNTVVWDGERYSITVKKLFWALSLFLLGILLSHWLSKGVERRVKNSFARNETLSLLSRHIVFYVLLFFFFLAALRIVRIPLTAFAFVGGAIVLGITFGTQNIFANLIGGVIVMSTRLFKLRDIVQVGEHTGYVAEITSRATVLNCFDGTEAVFPNQYFLENCFVNWTRKDPHLRVRVSMPVALDADIEEVQNLILDCAKNEPNVLDFPAPDVFLESFDHKKLLFTLRYWINVQENDIRITSGRVLKDILKGLRARGWQAHWPFKEDNTPGHKGQP